MENSKLTAMELEGMSHVTFQMSKAEGWKACLKFREALTESGICYHLERVTGSVIAVVIDK